MSEPSLLLDRRDLLAASAAVGALNVLPMGVANAGEGGAMRPFTCHVPQAEIDELRRRIAATPLARKGDCRRLLAGRAARDNGGPRTLLGDRLRLA